MLTDSHQLYLRVVDLQFLCVNTISIADKLAILSHQLMFRGSLKATEVFLHDVLRAEESPKATILALSVYDTYTQHEKTATVKTDLQ